MSESATQPQNRKFLNGALWMIAMRWMMRLFGLVSTIILARLLTPTDFGIVALALIVVGLLEVLSWTALDLALIQKQETTREHYDTAWTMQILQGLFIALLLSVLSPYAAHYFDEPALTNVVYLLALKVFIYGFQNIAVVDFRKDLNFSREFNFHLYKKAFTFLFVVSLAFILKNYWALIYGMLAASVIEVIISYRMHPFRPRLSLARIRDIWTFSQWILLSRLGYFLNQKTDQFVIGGASETEVMGVYHMSTEIGTMPSTEVVMPLRRAFFPNFAKIMHLPDEYRRYILSTIGIISGLIFASGVGLSAISEDFVLLVLGEKWVDSIPLIQVLAIFGVVAALSSAMELLLLVSGKGNLSTIESWIQLIVLVPVVWFAAHTYGVYEVAFSRTLIASLFVFLMIYFLTIATPVSFFSVIGVIWRPFLASIIMFFVVKLCHQDNLDYIALRLLMDVSIGALTYIGSVYLLWIMTGRSEGLEQTVISKIWLFFDKKKARAET
ncbi:MAG: lipopolysaccharide biosynthesis protein [Burkholderiales bacterium]|nr:lipopolysaccharide biosynthesis protein [Burkholderiales bacterium]MDR4517010.1 lipopolysaccharide biosynthesis protein [Nitrosomonas sp.]